MARPQNYSLTYQQNFQTSTRSAPSAHLLWLSCLLAHIQDYPISLCEHCVKTSQCLGVPKAYPFPTTRANQTQVPNLEETRREEMLCLQIATRKPGWEKVFKKNTGCYGS